MRALFVCAVAFMAMTVAASPTQDFDALFKDFKRKYNRQYASVAEEAFRRNVFEENMIRAADLQKQNPIATFGMTIYADVPKAEFKKTHHNVDFSKRLAKRNPIEVSDVAGGEKINWVDKGAVTGVKNQLQCGGCWAFSTTGSIEGQWFLAGHELVSLSEQMLISCAGDGNMGCGGGLPTDAFTWLVQDNSGNIDTEASYPFVSGDGSAPACSMSGRQIGATISGQVDLPQSETKIASFLYTNGPVSIGVDGSSFQTYTGGILTNCQDVQLDHAVLIVGFDETNSPPYWIIKNSWGTSWGEAGYIRVEKGTNQCGLKDAASSATVSKSASPEPSTPVTQAPPAPSGGGGTFTQKVCTDSACTEGCQSNTLPQNTCLKLNGGGSATAVCSSSGLTLTEYPLSTDCSGFSIPSSQPVNQCVEDTQGTYLENICSSSAAAAMIDAKVHSIRKQ